MNPFTVFTLSGPVIGGTGFALDWMWLFWIGVALAFINLFLNLASGAMKAPILPIVFIGFGAVAYEPGFVGAGLGLLAWTLIEGFGELLPRGIRQ